MQYHAKPCNTMQYHAIPCNNMQYHAIPCNTMQYHAIPCNTMQYHAIPCNTMHHHAIPKRRVGQLKGIHNTHGCSKPNTQESCQMLSVDTVPGILLAIKHTLAYSGILWH